MKRARLQTPLLVTVLTSAAAAPLVIAGCSSSSSNDDVPLAGDPAVGPQRLTETGLYADFASRTLASNILRFAPAHPLWADGAEKTRFLFLPPGTKIDTHDMDRWVFPVGTKAWKEFRVDGKLVETRLLWKRAEEPGVASWWKAAYVWEPDGSDAIASTEGVPSALGTTHDVPKQQDCSFCHLYARDAIIGFSAMELSPPSPPPAASTSATADTGLLLPFATQGIFTHPPSADFAVPGSGGVRDALAYLHGNCGFCHNDRMEQLTLRRIHFRLSTSDTVVEQTGPYTTTFHAKTSHIIEGTDEAIVPGDPDKSQAYVRMTTPSVLRMPPKGTKIVDPSGSALIRDWIVGLPR